MNKLPLIVISALFVLAIISITDAPALIPSPEGEPAGGQVVEEYPEFAQRVILPLTDNIPEPALIFDTARYEFGYDDESHGSAGGAQFFGTMDKAGVHKDVVAEYGNVDDDLDVIVGDQLVRELGAVADHGIELNEDLHWNVEIWEVVQVGDELRYVVSAAYGKDDNGLPGPRFSSHPNGTVLTFFELWLKRDGEPPSLLRRSDQWTNADVEI